MQSGSRRGARLGALGALVAVSAATAFQLQAGAPARAAQAGVVRPFAGAGSWVSLYDSRAWENPERVIRTLAARRVQTLFLETSNYKHSDWLYEPSRVGRFVDAAHRAGLAVVAWTLPSLATPRADLRRAQAAIRFRSRRGERFDGFALDVESTQVRSIARRNARAVQLAAAVRRAAHRLPLGMITIAPVGSSPSFWSHYPFRGLARSADALLPMAYFTYRTSGPRRVAAYTAANVRVIRRQAGRRVAIAPIGGEATDATRAELAAFFRAAAAEGSVGASLWEYGETTPRQWQTLAPSRSTFAASASR